MLFDILLDFWNGILESMNAGLPAGEKSLEGLSRDFLEFAAIILFYVDVTPLKVFFEALLAVLTTFIVFKLALFVYKLIPFVS